jgi:hypothetical protein
MPRGDYCNTCIWGSTYNILRGQICFAILTFFIANTVFLKLTPLFTLSLGLLSPPVPSFSEVRKVRKFY